MISDRRSRFDDMSAYVTTPLIALQEDEGKEEEEEKEKERKAKAV